MRVAQVRKSLTSVYDMCAAGHRVVFDFDSNNNDASHSENKLTGEKTDFKLRNRVWELEIAVFPKTETEEILTKMQKQDVEELCPVKGQVFLTVRPVEMRVPADLGPKRVDEEQEGRDVMEESDHDPACEPGAIRARAVLVGPTRQDREDHEAAGHVPQKSWCQACVAGRGRSDAHLTHQNVP